VKSAPCWLVGLARKTEARLALPLRSQPPAPTRPCVRALRNVIPDYTNNLTVNSVNGGRAGKGAPGIHWDCALERDDMKHGQRRPGDAEAA
jgi:hypothetical protein